MMGNIDNMARIEREIEKRMEAACEKNGWVVAVAMMPPETTALHIEKFGEKPIASEDAQAALENAPAPKASGCPRATPELLRSKSRKRSRAVAFAKAEFGTEATVERLEEKIPNTRAPYYVTFLVRVDASKRVKELAA